MRYKLHQGDALQVLSKAPAEFVHCCVTSAPYYKQRDYGHPDQLGQEGSVKRFVANLVGVLAKCAAC